MKTVFIDGSAGTTGLRIYERLQAREDISLMTLPDALRKNPQAKREALNRCDLAFLCLPDAAAIEDAQMVENPNVVILDTSTAHRTNPAWVYGFPELSPAHEEAIRCAKRIAVPGCHASGFIALVYPLVAAGILEPDALLTCHSLTGFSGGGKKMIAAYGEENRPTLYDAPRQYGLNQQHKHLPEMTVVTGLKNSPIFCPIVADFYSGMEVTVPLFRAQMAKGMSVKELQDFYSSWYHSPLVYCAEVPDDDGMLSACALSSKDAMCIHATGNDERILITARYDNLGKGASGAAIECMNLVLGLDPATGLEI